MADTILPQNDSNFNPPFDIRWYDLTNGDRPPRGAYGVALIKQHRTGKLIVSLAFRWGDIHARIERMLPNPIAFADSRYVKIDRWIADRFDAPLGVIRDEAGFIAYLKSVMPSLKVE